MKRLDRVTQLITRHSLSKIAAMAVAGLAISTNGLLLGQEIQPTGELAEVTTRWATDSNVVEDGFIATLVSIPQHQLLIAIIAILGSTLIGYNVLTSGKSGWGWFAICVAAGMVAVLGKIGLSMFCEMATNNEIADWDED